MTIFKYIFCLVVLYTVVAALYQLIQGMWWQARR